MGTSASLTSGKDGNPRKEFCFYGDVAFVTYTRSHIHDKEEFSKALQWSLRKSLRSRRSTAGVGVSLFGSRELHKDGTPHYHVLVRFSEKVYWKEARKMFSVWTWNNGQSVLDTQSIYIRRRDKAEEVGKFLYCVQRYIAKRGDVFGHWVVN